MMDEIDFEILRLLEKEGPKTTVQVSEHIGKSKYVTELRLLRLKPIIRELQSKKRGPNIWWLPSLYEYMCKVAKMRLMSMGYEISKRGGLDFYGSNNRDIGGICSDILDEDRIRYEATKYYLDEFILLTTRDLEIDEITVWNLMDSPKSNIGFIPISKDINNKLIKNFNHKTNFVDFCSKIVKKGIEAEKWGI